MAEGEAGYMTWEFSEPEGEGVREWTIWPCDHGGVEVEPGGGRERMTCQKCGANPVTVVLKSEADQLRANYETLEAQLEKERGPWIEQVIAQTVPAFQAMERRAEAAESQLSEVRAERDRARDQIGRLNAGECPCRDDHESWCPIYRAEQAEANAGSLAQHIAWIRHLVKGSNNPFAEKVRLLLSDKEQG